MAVTELGARDSIGWEGISPRTAESLIDRTISSFNDIAKLRQNIQF